MSGRPPLLRLSFDSVARAGGDHSIEAPPKICMMHGAVTNGWQDATAQRMTGLPGRQTVRQTTHLPSRPLRDTRLDIVRGWLQLTIFVSHAAVPGISGWLIHGAWGLSDSAEQFVFLSGFVLGSLFARQWTKYGWTDAARDMLGRAARLYRTQLIVFALMGSAVIVADHSGLLPGGIERLGWGYLADDPARAVLAALTMLYQPTWMDILPVFIWCMALLPFFAALEGALGSMALLAPLAVYTASWAGGLWPPSLGPGTHIGFNPFAWQLLFLLGAWLGRRALLFGQALPPSRWLTALAVAILLAGLALRLGWYGVLPSSALVPEAPVIVGKAGLALPRVLHALALAWLVSRLVPRDAAWMHRTLFRWLASAGRHSLPVFCLGLFLSLGVQAAMSHCVGCWWLGPPILVFVSAGLLIFAVQLDQHRTVRQVGVAT